MVSEVLRMITPTDEAGMLAAVKQYGPAPGARKMLDNEMEAGIWAIENNLYGTWQCTATGEDCTRIGPKSKCFCGHTLAQHKTHSRMIGCSECPCKFFDHVPTRPEEVRMGWVGGQ